MFKIALTIITLFFFGAKGQDIIFKLVDARTQSLVRTATITGTRSERAVRSTSDGLYRLTEFPGQEQIFKIFDFSCKPVSQTITVPPYDNPWSSRIYLVANDRTQANVGSQQASKAREVFDATAPINVLTHEDIVKSSFTELAQVLQWSMASVNSNRQVIADGTDHIDPVSLRGFGPDQILILINGKRRHSSALVNINNTFGRGNVSTDLNTIPLHLIKRVEVLRGDAASLYGSDAIAGVVMYSAMERISLQNRQTATRGSLGRVSLSDRFV